MFKRIESMKELSEKARKLRVDILEMTSRANSGHPGGSLSSADIVAALYFNKMKHDPKNPNWEQRDRFVLSKGHVCPVVYAALAETGYFPRTELKKLRKLGSMLQGHPNAKKTPGIEFSTGSLGQGLSHANGVAKVLKDKESDSRVYVLMGDGELQEGQVWEAAMTAAHHKLNNVTAIVDCNGLQIDGKVEEIKSIEPLAEKWKAFGWNVIKANGHDLKQLLEAFEKAEKNKDKPTVILADTVKGKGVSFMEHQAKYHGTALPLAEEKGRDLPHALEELGEPKQKIIETIAELKSEKESQKAKAKKSVGTVASLRTAYGEALAALGEKKDIFVLEADLSGSTKTSIFNKKFGGKNFVNVGLSEQDMMSMGAGTAAEGKKTFVNTFAVFNTRRALDQLFMAGYDQKNPDIIITSTHGGITVGEDGASHQALDDIAAVRGMNLKIIAPGDVNEVKKAVEFMGEHKGPFYFRLPRGDLPVLREHEFKLGKWEKLRNGKAATIFAYGPLLHEALEAADLLAKKGIKIQVFNASSIKPFDKKAILKAAKKTGAVITAEDHSIYGGLGSIVAETLSENGISVPFERVGTTGFGESGDSNELLKARGMNAESIAQRVEKMLGKKKQAKRK